MAATEWPLLCSDCKLGGRRSCQESRPLAPRTLEREARALEDAPETSAGIYWLMTLSPSSDIRSDIREPQHRRKSSGREASQKNRPLDSVDSAYKHRIFT